MNTSGAEGSQVAAPRGNSVLNAFAPAFHQPVYSDRRCLFLTFSNGFPLTESQIFAFFTMLYGPYVEDVYVHRPRPVGRMAKPSLFGKVMFKLPLITDLVMGPYEKVSFCVDGRPMYCRRFVSQKPNTANAALRDG